MRLLILFFFSTIVTVRIESFAAPSTTLTPEKISTTPSMVPIDELDDLEPTHSKYFFSYGLGRLSGHLLESEKQITCNFGEIKINYRERPEKLLSVGFSLTTSHFLILEFSRQQYTSSFDQIKAYYRLSVAPTFNPSEGPSTFSDLRKLQFRALVGADEVFIKKQRGIPLSLGFEIGIGYALIGISNSLKINLSF